MPDVEQQWQHIQAADIVRELLNEFGTVAEYRVLRDSLPRRLTALLRCRCVLLYQRMSETLQFVAGSFDDKPGWSTSLLGAAHINPINLSSDGPEARAWRERHAIVEAEGYPTLVALPLMYRHRGMGVMVALRGKGGRQGNDAETWTADEIRGLDVIADIVALLLENTRLLERDRERIHELSLLNSISSQMNCAMYERERLKTIIIQRSREISLADICTLIEPGMPDGTTSWVTPALREVLLQHFHERQAPLMIERPGDGNDPRVADYLQKLPVEVKTFFAFPLLNSQETDRTHRSSSEVLGIIIGAYYHVWKLRREEIVLLQVLANQASAVLKNIQLMAKVVEAREEKRRLDRLAALGEMAANVAHEVRNPLASIKTAMQMLAGELVSSEVFQPACYATTADQTSLVYSGEHGEQSEENSVQEGALESIDVVLKEVERLDTIVRELLQFARPRQLHRSRCSIAELSDHVLHLLQRQCSEASVVVHREYASVPSFMVDIAQMEQVLLNLYMNAIQAMADGGILTVACHHISREQALHEARGTQLAPVSLSIGETYVSARCVQAGSEKEGQWLELVVSDTGPGIAPDYAERIFQPFFTTRAHGIGLGLAITRRLVEDHGGYIWVGGQSGYGATISVRLPLVAERDGEDGSG